MIFVCNLITFAIATTFVPYTNQVPYRGFNVQAEQYGGIHYNKPGHLLQELYNLDGSVVDELSNMRSRKVKGKKLYGKKTLSKVHVPAKGETTNQQKEQKPPPKIDVYYKNGKRYYLLKNQFTFVDGHLRPIYIDDDRKEYYYGPPRASQMKSTTWTACFEITTTKIPHDYHPLR